MVKSPGCLGVAGHRLAHGLLLCFSAYVGFWGNILFHPWITTIWRGGSVSGNRFVLLLHGCDGDKE